MKAVQVSGRFMRENGNPAEGMIEFIPSRIWVDHEDQTYPTMAFTGELVNGAFLVYLTRTDTGDVPWHYVVRCPVGTWTIEITEDGPLYLKKLLPEHLL